MFIDKTVILKNVLKARAFFLDLLFPIECLSCGREGEWLCQRCFGKIRFNETQYCFHCKKEKERGQFCRACQQAYFPDGVWIAGDYEDKLLMEMVKNLKYRFAKDIAGALSKFLILFLNSMENSPLITAGAGQVKGVRGIIGKKWLIIPVPLHPRRLRWRGFNQAEEIARAVAEHFGIKMESGILVRTKHKQPQVKLNMKERAENIKGCFTIKEPPLLKGGKGGFKNSLDKGPFRQSECEARDWGILSNRNIILLDDVATTGATLNECARVLKANGAREVWGLVAAKG